MGWRRMVAIVAAVGIGFTAYLTVLSAAGLGDFSGGGPAITPAAPQPSEPATSGTQSGNGGLVVVAKDIKFSPEKLTASAGPLTLTLKNEDGTVHNIHVFKGKDNSGESVGATQPKAGPGTETLQFTAEPGTYFYQCDVHPSQMTGTLQVSAAGGAGQ